jgi:hypothetical protein
LIKDIYVVLFRNSGIGYILVGDYSDGLDADNIKWFIWKGTIFVPFGLVHTVIFVSGTTNVPELAISDGNGIFSLSLRTSTDIDQSFGGADSPITAILKTPVIVNGNDDGNTQQINTVRVRLKMTGANTPTITAQAISNSDSSKVGTQQTFPFVGAAGKMQDKWMYLPFVDDQPQIKFTVVSTGTPLISRIAIEGDEYGESDPQ